MIRRIGGRAAFQQLARDGARIRRSALWCSWCPDPRSDSTTTAVAFALGRRLGPAVVRNRLRRRLRALCRELDDQHRLPPGLLLIGASPPAVELTFDELRTELTAMLAQVAIRQARVRSNA